MNISNARKSYNLKRRKYFIFIFFVMLIFFFITVFRFAALNVLHLILNYCILK